MTGLQISGKEQARQRVRKGHRDATESLEEGLAGISGHHALASASFACTCLGLMLCGVDG